MSFQIIQNTPKNQLKYSDFTFAYATITFPKRWQWKLHPVLEAEGDQDNKLEDAIIHKMKHLGLLTTLKEEEMVRKMNIKGYGGYAFSSGDWKRLYLNSFYVTLWLYWDDKEVENSSKELQDFEQILAAIACDPISKSADRYTLAWAYIARELLLAGASKQYMEQLSNKMKQWLRYAIQERKRAACVAQNRFDNHLFTYSDYLHQRMVTIGMIPTAQLVEEDVGFKQMSKYSHLPEIDELIECSGYLVAYMNELVSTVKDSEQNYSNLVGLGMQKYKMTVQEIKDFLVEKHAAAVKRYDQLENLILYKVEEQDKAKMQSWIQALRLTISGFEYWHLLAPRYTSHFVLENDFLLRTAIDIVDDCKIH